MSSFGAEFEKIWPDVCSPPKFSDYGKQLLEKCRLIKKPEVLDVDIEEFQRKSSQFPIEFGINSCRVMSQPKERFPNIKHQISSAYPLIHERVLKLYLDFLEYKCQYGNGIEKQVFTGLNVNDLVQRLLSKRCVCFFGKNDRYRLLTNEQGYSGFVEVGTSNERPPLLLTNVLSYDEIKLSAFLSVTSYTEFINDGNRKNCGVIPANKKNIVDEGVVIGIIGARLNRRFVMEYQDIIINKTQNVSSNGYGVNSIDNKTSAYRAVWNNFYEESDILYDKCQMDGQRFMRSKNSQDIFDNLLMKKRYTISLDTLLLESNDRGLKASKLSYIHVVGIGLGVWQIAEQQEKIFLETLSQRIQQLLPHLNHIGVVHCSWFRLSQWHDLKDGIKFQSATHPLGGITVYISKRNPADCLPAPECSDMLLIVSYAWDGNALPGNEFWLKMLKSTGDSSTACSTLITELHNPHINSDWVHGNNLHVASATHGVLHIADYAEKYFIK